MAKKIAITNQKGGVGKTTTALGLAGGLRIKGRRVLIIDLDAQGNASAAAGLILESGSKTLKDLIAEQETIPADYVVQTEMGDIIPSNNSLKDIEPDLIRESHFDILKKIVHSIEHEYDYIIYDCPPSINVFTKNALVAADEIIIPVDVGYFSILGLKQLLEEIEHIKNNLNKSLTLRGVLACRFDKRTTLSKQVLEILQGNFPDVLFKTVIRVNIDIVRSQISQKNIFEYNMKSTAAEDFLLLTEEILYG